MLEKFPNHQTNRILETDYPLVVLPLALEPLSLGAITPNGWLLTELQTEANGLAGHEHDFYKFVSDSSWTGGSSEYSGLNEGLPYWFNGLIPLAYSLNDSRLKSQVQQVADKVLSLQASDGWIGPEEGVARNFWGRMPFFLGLMNLADADSNYTDKIVASLTKFYPLMHSMLSNNYTGYKYQQGDSLSEGDTTWGRVRYQDMLISMMWMYENHAGNLSQILLDNMNYLQNGSLSWNAWYNSDTYIRENLWDVPGSASEIGGPLYPYEHGVNVGQGLKAPAVDRRLTKNDSLIQTALDAVQWTFKYHGAASGTVLADERIDGLEPFSGSELCTAVETAYSLSYLYQALGVSDYADRAELTIFNALPSMLTGDWWAHQYMEQPNQPVAAHLAQTPFSTSNTVAQSFGLEPQYPCCVVNHPQGLPKFLMGAFLKNGDNGLAHALLSPSTVKTQLSSGSVSIECQTDYPFGNKLQYQIHADAPFDFFVRVPSWVLSDSTITVGSATPSPLSPSDYGLHKIGLPGGSSQVVYTLSRTVTTDKRANDTIAVYYGPLLYALRIGSTNTSTPPMQYDNMESPVPNAPPQARDWQITNTTAWNYAIDPQSLSLSQQGAMPSGPVFEPDAPPISITARACQIDWPLFKNSVPGWVPTGTARKCISKVENVTLVPYGSAKIHMAELPTLDLSGM